MDGIVGMRFHPTNEELISHYLRKKRLDPNFSVQKIREINIYSYEPEELPGLALIQLNEPIWYFYVAPEYKNGKGRRLNRRTEGGIWKVTGEERKIKDRRTGKVIGTKRTLVFYRGRKTTKDAKTDWVMHEYHCKPDPLFKEEFVVVCIKIKANNRHDSSTPNEGVQSHHLTSDSGDHITVVSQVESQVLPNNHNHISSEDHAANMKESQSVSNHNISFNAAVQLLPNHDISFNRAAQPLPNHDASSNRASHPLPNHDISFNKPSQPLPNHDASTQPIPNHNISFNQESQLLPNQHFISEVEPLVPEEWDAIFDSNGLDHNSTSNLQTQMHLQQESSHSNSISNDLNVLNPLVDIEQEDNWRNSQWALQDEFFGNETGHRCPPDFSSSEPVTAAYFCDGSDADPKTIATMAAGLLDGFSSMATGEYYFNSLCEPQLYSAVDENILPVQMSNVV